MRPPLFESGQQVVSLIDAPGLTRNGNPCGIKKAEKYRLLEKTDAAAKVHFADGTPANLTTLKAAGQGHTTAVAYDFHAAKAAIVNHIGY